MPKTLWPEDTELDDLNAEIQYRNGRMILRDYRTKLASIDSWQWRNQSCFTALTVNTTALAAQSTSSPNGAQLTRCF